MAIYHCKITPIARSTGKSAPCSAAYRAAERLYDERLDVWRDFTRKRGVVHKEIMVPEIAPIWSADRERLWNAQEACENNHPKRDSARLARDIQVALPAEATEKQHLGALRELGAYVVDRFEGAADIALHAPPEKGHERNVHGHIMLSSRRMGADGFTEKIRELDDKVRGPAEIEDVRWKWEGIQNRLHDELGLPHVSRLSYRERGINREPTVTLGARATELERQGVPTHRGDINRAIEAANREPEGQEPEPARYWYSPIVERGRSLVDRARPYYERAKTWFQSWRKPPDLGSSVEKNFVDNSLIKDEPNVPRELRPDPTAYWRGLDAARPPAPVRPREREFEHDREREF